MPSALKFRKILVVGAVIYFVFAILDLNCAESSDCGRHLLGDIPSDPPGSGREILTATAFSHSRGYEMSAWGSHRDK
jgi:hypothetical protein